MGSNYCVFFIVHLSKALLEGFQTRVGYCLSWRCREARSWSDPICQSCHISKGGILLENEILRITLKAYFPVQLKTNYVFPCRFKQWFNHYLIDTIENVYLNFCTLIFRDNILFDFQVPFLHYSECECLSEQNIFWVVGQSDFGFPPIMRSSIGIQKLISFYQTRVRSLHTLVSYYSNSCKVDSTGRKILKWWPIFYVQRWHKTRFY